MSWLQFDMHLGTLDAGRVEQAMRMAGAIAVTFSDAGNAPVYQTDTILPALWSDTRVTGLFHADLDVSNLYVALLAMLGVEQLPAHHLQHLEDREWSREWLKEFRPKQFGQRLWVCPCHAPPPNPSAINILLDPGLAFGTGTHPTTALCLEWLDGAELAGKTIIDYGCGSGILAIAAVRLGAGHAWAVDTDPQALTACYENACRNGVAGRLDIGPPAALGQIQADVLVANILAMPLRKLAPRFARLVRPGGTLLLSGILASQRNEVLSAYVPWFLFSGGAERQEWLRMDGLRQEPN